jgi:hypothetical protein
VLLVEDAVVDAAVVGQYQRAQARVLALGGRPWRSGLPLEPDVGIEAGLMAGMAGRGRAAARLADVADIERRLAGGAYSFRQGLDELERDGLAPVAIATDANGFVARAFQGEQAARPARSLRCRSRSIAPAPAPAS